MLITITLEVHKYVVRTHVSHNDCILFLENHTIKRVSLISGCVLDQAYFSFAS